VIVKTESVEVPSEVEIRLEGMSVEGGKAELTWGVSSGDGTPDFPLKIEDPAEAESTAEKAVLELDIVPDELEDGFEGVMTTEVNGEEGVPLDDDSDEDGAGEVGARAESSRVDDGVGDGKLDVPRMVVEGSPS